MASLLIILEVTDLLTSGELELSTTQSLNDVVFVVLSGTDRHDWLTNVHSCNGSLGFAECSTHTGLQAEMNSYGNIGKFLILFKKLTNSLDGWMSLTYFHKGTCLIDMETN